MNVDLKNASLLLYGKILKIGDIESNHSISLSRANTIDSSIKDMKIKLNEFYESNIEKKMFKYELLK